MRHRLAFVLSVACYLSANAASAHAADDPSKRDAAEARAKLAFIVGTWTIEGMEKDFTETCTWYHNQSHVVCNSESNEPSGVRKGVSLFSYSARTGRYAYYHYDSSGVVNAMDLFIGDRALIATSEREVGSDLVREQVTMSRRADGSYDFRQEKSTNGEPWKVSTSFHYVPKSNSPN